MMTVSDNLEPQQEQQQQQQDATKKDMTKKKAIKPTNKYKRETNQRFPNYHHSMRYYHESYPTSYIYYPPLNHYYRTPFESNTNTRDDEDLEIIMHDESSSSLNNTSSVETSLRSSDQNKTVDLKRQLEYYFSRQNLVNDTWLVSQMDSELYVPISLIANFKRVREWTTDIELIVKTLRESSEVTVDETGTRVKPNISVQRKTVILRDMPDCTEEEINQLLKDLNSPPVQSIKKDIGNMWYFTFESEDDALTLLSSVRGKSFKDQAIAARMKSEPTLRVQARTQDTVKPSSLIPEVYPPYSGYYYPSFMSPYSNSPRHNHSYRPSVKKPFYNNIRQQNNYYHQQNRPNAQKEDIHVRNGKQQDNLLPSDSSKQQRPAYRNNNNVQKSYHNNNKQHNHNFRQSQANNAKLNTKDKPIITAKEQEKSESLKNEIPLKKKPYTKNQKYNKKNKKEEQAKELKPVHFPPLSNQSFEVDLKMALPTTDDEDILKAKDRTIVSYADMLKK
ncbi:uncharacterized protein B0P05DRAFT_534820 [Gilbertella persicaria]|uniref:uncharacterized protein n=1 Tax=Gilbertella persicaria TaxID=101096 RepID=UPI002220BAC3|nr:uncharacterized protein B0P05DRAFT_534820 [Gilbertella persicaria]KAI8084251.1 hypothetical protein B0P05DRAFT_534820 [Gilbertella persicaria]